MSLHIKSLIVSSLTWGGLLCSSLTWWRYHGLLPVLKDCLLHKIFEQIVHSGEHPSREHLRYPRDDPTEKKTIFVARPVLIEQIEGWPITPAHVLYSTCRHIFSQTLILIFIFGCSLTERRGPWTSLKRESKLVCSSITYFLNSNRDLHTSKGKRVPSS